MARKKKHPAHENHERWLVSYADFITLLFAFFVVMFATSQTDKGKAKQVSEAVKDAIENGSVSAMVREVLGGAPDEKGKAGARAEVREILGGTVDDKGKGNAMLKGPGGAQIFVKDIPETAIAQLLPSHAYLSRELEQAVEAGVLSIKMEKRGLVVSLSQASFFPSGQDTLDPKTYPVLAKVASAVKDLPNKVRFEGHTDSIPIHNERFRSNWELSAARGIATLEVLAGKFGVPYEQMAVGGYADTAPVAGNDTEEGRARNRRVDIVILSQERVIDTEPNQPSAADRVAPAGHGKAAPSHGAPKKAH
jgi:chemotaxis protein MotB